MTRKFLATIAALVLVLAVAVPAFAADDYLPDPTIGGNAVPSTGGNFGANYIVALKFCNDYAGTNTLKDIGTMNMYGSQSVRAMYIWKSGNNGLPDFTHTMNVVGWGFWFIDVNADNVSLSGTSDYVWVGIQAFTGNQEIDFGTTASHSGVVGAAAHICDRASHTGSTITNLSNFSAGSVWWYDVITDFSV